MYCDFDSPHFAKLTAGDTDREFSWRAIDRPLPRSWPAEAARVAVCDGISGE
jgi:hypothetical protein